MTKKISLDKFYSSQEAVAQLLKHIDLNNFDVIIEPSAGAGSFLKQLPLQKTFAYDLVPESDNIIKKNWLAPFDEKGNRDDSLYIKDKENFFDSQNKKILVVGNPPFGKNNKLAKEFIKESTFADTVAFILPKSFLKTSLINSLPKNYEIIENEVVVNDMFEFEDEKIKVPTTILILKKLPEGQQRQKIQDESSKYFTFLNKKDYGQADAMIVRVGGQSGKLLSLSEKNDKNIKYNYFIKFNEEIDFDHLKAIFKNGSDELKQISENSTGPKSLSRGEIASITNKY